MAQELDEHVKEFRTRRLTEGPHTFVATDALVMKVREGGRVVKVSTLVATGINHHGLDLSACHSLSRRRVCRRHVKECAVRNEPFLGMGCRRVCDAQSGRAREDVPPEWVRLVKTSTTA